MEYIAIVDKINDNYAKGIYTARLANFEDTSNYYKKWYTDSKDFIKNLKSNFKKDTFFDDAYELLLRPENREYSVVNINEFEAGESKIVFETDFLYSKPNQKSQIFHGLFEEFGSKKILENILQSRGGSRLTMIERKDAEIYTHFGSKDGIFSFGLYCKHPKDETILIPLKNSGELIKNMILEEALRAYEALGAKKIIIEEIIENKSDVGGKKSKIAVQANFSQKKEILREKKFGKGTFDPERAMKESKFIHDFPNIMTTIKGRINGNLILEKFVETVNLDGGLDVNVLNLFAANSNFNYSRKWQIEIEFYDKNE